MPGRLLNHLTKTDSLPLSLWNNSGFEWLILDKVDHLLDGGSFRGQVEQILQRLHGCRRGPVGGVGAARAFPSVLVSATVTSKLEWMARRLPSGDGNGWGWAWARGHNDNNATFKSGGGCER
jgi:superfamily II DNA/RNA helicase